MNGNDLRGIVLQDRDRNLLRELAVLRIIDREQTKIIAGFKSTTRSNVRLLALTHAGLLKRFFIGTIAGGRKALYTLSTKGAALVGVTTRGLDRKSDELLIGDIFVDHQLKINSIYIFVKYDLLPSGAQFVRWRTFSEPLSKSIAITPDGYFEINFSNLIRPMFLEVDQGTEALKTWKKKIDAYLRFAVSGDFTRLFHHPQFRVLIIANSERRLTTIRKTVARSTEKVFWFRTLDSINRDGFWIAAWLRPKGDQKQSLG